MHISLCRPDASDNTASLRRLSLVPKERKKERKKDSVEPVYEFPFLFAIRAFMIMYIYLLVSNLLILFQ